MNKSTLGSQVGKNKESTHLKINYKRFQILEEDDIAQVEEIFKHFDFSNRGRVATADLPNILRLLEFNIGKIEERPGLVCSTVRSSDNKKLSQKSIKWTYD